MPTIYKNPIIVATTVLGCDAIRFGNYHAAAVSNADDPTLDAHGSGLVQMQPKIPGRQPLLSGLLQKAEDSNKGSAEGKEVGRMFSRDFFSKQYHSGEEIVSAHE